MWPGTTLPDEPRVRTMEVMGGKGKIGCDREPLKAALRREQKENVGEQKVVRNIGLCVAMQVKVKGSRKTELESMGQEGE